MNKRIGDMNGAWGVMFKISLAFAPITLSLLLGWGVWVTKQISKHDAQIEAQAAAAWTVSKQYQYNYQLNANNQTLRVPDMGQIK